MFNQELKERFIREHTSSISVANACMSLFNAIEKFEVGWEADICTRTAAEAQPVVDEIAGLRTGRKQLRVNILKDYVKWCITNNIPGACDGVLQTDTSGAENMRKKTVKSPLHLQMYLNALFEKESEETLDNIYRCFYWLAYAGMAEQDIFNVKVMDVDLSNLSVRFDGYEYPIYREALDCFRNCVHLSQFVYKHPNYTNTGVVYKPRADGDRLIRGLRPTVSVPAMRVELSRRSARGIEEHKTDLQLSYYRVWLSGVFYRMYELERAGFPADFSGVAANFMEGKQYKLDTSRLTREGYRRKVTGEYLHDYENWKKTF